MPFINGIGPLELIIVLVIALLVIGPGKLPEVGSALGKSIREFRKASSDVQEAAKIDTTPLPPAPATAATAATAAVAPVDSAAPAAAASAEPVVTADAVALADAVATTEPVAAAPATASSPPAPAVATAEPTTEPNR